MSFYTAINCMDGRVQEPIIKYAKETFSVKYIDMITEAGPVAQLTFENENKLTSLFVKINISLQKHNSKGILVVAHFDCAGNPVSDKTQKQHIKRAVSYLQQKFPDTKINGVWVNQNQEVET